MALSQAVMAGESALEAKTQGFAAGINTNLDVLDATRDLYRAKRDLSSARYDYLLNLLRLKQAAGTLSESDVSQINGWLRLP
jgi:outer membrane protein